MMLLLLLFSYFIGKEIVVVTSAYVGRVSLCIYNPYAYYSTSSLCTKKVLKEDRLIQRTQFDNYL